SERGLPSDHERDRHFVLAGLLPGGRMMADMLGAPHQHRDTVAARQHAAIDADVHRAGRRLPGHAARIGEDVAPAVEPIPMPHGELVEIDVAAAADILLGRPAGADSRWDTSDEAGA